LSFGFAYIYKLALFGHFISINEKFADHVDVGIDENLQYFQEKAFS
jgi:hypothetical protein